MANIKNLETAISLYNIKHGDFPRLSEVPYTSLEVDEFAQMVYDNTGLELELDPKGNYYDIDYNNLSKYISRPDDYKHYILRNPIGRVYYLDKLTEKGETRVENWVSKKPTNPIDKNEPIFNYGQCGFSGLEPNIFDIKKHYYIVLFLK